MKTITLIAIAALTATPAIAKDAIDFGKVPPQAGFQSMAEDLVKAQLKDPASATFDWSRGEVKLGKKGWFTCGRVNSKNSYGGYEGFSAFIVHMDPKDGNWFTNLRMAPVGLGFTECDKPSLGPA